MQFMCGITFQGYNIHCSKPNFMSSVPCPYYPENVFQSMLTKNKFWVQKQVYGILGTLFSTLSL